MSAKIKCNNIYIDYLKAVCSLSKLFSKSKTPYLHYRLAENIFCEAFKADNLSRSDLAYDARIGKLGFGIKTFIAKKASPQKIAEFNALSGQLKKLSTKNLAIKLSELRNERIEFANRTYGIESAIYHCIARSEKGLNIFESDYSLIDIKNIVKIKERKGNIIFEDGQNEYSFNFSKSTLFKKFHIPHKVYRVDIEILDKPLRLIVQLFNRHSKILSKEKFTGTDFVILPLYSLRDSRGDNKVVSQKSALNQWNAGGRARDKGEVYIPVPKIIHKKYLGFFPDRDTPFNLHIPTGEALNAKLCQENSKALMTNPNKALSDWLLRDILKLKEGELLTYAKLKILGIDSVRITKLSDKNYKIDFAKTGSFEEFLGFD